MNLEIPLVIMARLWGEIGPGSRVGDSIHVMIETKICESVVDERADSGYTSKRFRCDDPGCLEPPGQHRHTYNIDPEYPGIPIPRAIFRTHQIEGYTCTSIGCPWKENLHIHLAKNE